MWTSRSLITVSIILCGVTLHGKDELDKPTEGLRMEFSPVFSKTGRLEKVMVLLANRGKETIVVGTKDFRKDGIRLTWEQFVLGTIDLKFSNQCW